MLKARFYTSMVFLLFLVSAVMADDGFVLIKGAEFKSGSILYKSRQQVRVDDFEILDHTITNAEYKAFTDDTGYPVPEYWENGEIPNGKKDYPVIYVNRYDMLAYLDWRSAKEGRLYRLPTTAEFEWASRGGLVDKLFPWGDKASPKFANYNHDHKRNYPDWEKWLQPAKSGYQNGYGLYHIMGNVWQGVDDRNDASAIRFKYRVIDPRCLEEGLAGGSWAVGEIYLHCGGTDSSIQGIKSPDKGFRPVREPNPGDWTILPRKSCVVQTGPSSVFLSWALLETDKQGDGFHVYRSDSRRHDGFRITKSPVKDGTCFIDDDVSPGKHYHYYVRSVNSKEKEGKRSDWTDIKVVDQETYLPIVTRFKPITKDQIVPIFGDLDGDGVMDCVIKMYNGNHEQSQNPKVPVQIEAFTSYGRSLWCKDVCWHDHCWGSASNVPFNVWDMDGDGKAEVICRMQIGDEVYVTILDGMTGKLKAKNLWPEMISDIYRSSTRIQLSIGYLDGVHPAVITQTGLYENEVLTAFDHNLKKLWEYKSTGATNGSGGHKIEVCDVDGDGKQEVFDGTTCLNSDGTLRWSIYKRHADKVKILDFLPDRPGLEVWYLIEDNINAGTYMCDASTGEIIWKENKEDDPRWSHGHNGWAADIWDGSPGMECLCTRTGHGDAKLAMFSADGRLLKKAQPFGYLPFEWDGDDTRELLSGSGRVIGNYDGDKVVTVEGEVPNPVPHSGLRMTADLYGDFRDELVLIVNDKDGPAVAVVTAVTPITKKYLTATTSLDYRLWLARNMGGGYPSIYDQPLIKAKK